MINFKIYFVKNNRFLKGYCYNKTTKKFSNVINTQVTAESGERFVLKVTGSKKFIKKLLNDTI